jgi:hypothetical protein
MTKVSGVRCQEKQAENLKPETLDLVFKIWDLGMRMWGGAPA